MALLIIGLLLTKYRGSLTGSVGETSAVSGWEKLHCGSIENYILDQCSSTDITLATYIF